MKKNYFFIALFLSFAGFAQFEITTYRGAFAPSPAAMWTDNWSNYDPQNTVYPATTVDVTATEINTNTTWTANNVYRLLSQVFVKNGATLTIEAGTVIRGEKTSKSAIIITKGAKIVANGTAISPIVFTSDKAVGSRAPGDWGGIILLGNSVYNTNGGVNNIEGLAISTDSQFGGGTTPNVNDNSGSMQFCRLEYPGAIFSANNEINGLTLGAVGAATTIENIQISYSGDDSFEWFGGTVNCKRLIAFAGTDDDFDTDFGYSGNVQFALGVRDPLLADTASGGASEGFESDNNNTTGFIGTPKTSATFSNFTLIGPSFRASLPNGSAAISQHQRAARIRRNSALKVHNSIFMDFKGGLFVENTQTEDNAFTSNEMRWRNNILAGTVSATPVLSTTAANSTTLANWYTTNNNTTLATNAGILTGAYDTTNGNSYVNRDFRPGSASPAASGADFTTLSSSIFETANAITAIYPNPSNTEFSIKFESNFTEQVILSVFDITGRNVETQKIDYSSIEDVQFGSNYNLGIYIVQLKQGDFTKSLKVVKK